MTTPTIADLSPGVIVQGPLLPEPVEVLATVPVGHSVKLIGRGLQTGQLRNTILSPEQVAQLTLTPKDLPFAGDQDHRVARHVDPRPGRAAPERCAP